MVSSPMSERAWSSLESRTCSGKTLAFLVPTVQRLIKLKARDEELKRQLRGTRCILLSPTRELAMQTDNVLHELLQHIPELRAGLIIGGHKMSEDVAKFSKGLDIVVATPGRLLDHMSHSTPCFIHRHLKVLVLDEADGILDAGFEEDMTKIIERLPKKRQTMLFSATLSNNKLSRLTEIALKEDRISIGLEDKGSVSTVAGLTQGYVVVPSEQRFNLLYTVLLRFAKSKIMVFFSSAMATKFYFELFNLIKLPVYYIHGRQKQSKRTMFYNQFLQDKSGTLLCTDLAARGLDIPAVDWIIQFDPPDDPTEYIHRVGRAVRKPGAEGNALIFLRPEEKKFLTFLENAKVPLDEFEFSSSDIINVQPQIEKQVTKFHSLMLSAMEGYKAYVRAYDSHHHKNIFNVNSLDLEKVAKSFGLTVAPAVTLTRDPEELASKRTRPQYYANARKKFKRN